MEIQIKMITAVIMAGGKGTRMQSDMEKPMVQIKGKPMIQHVYEAVKASHEVNNIYTATSKHTPLTTGFMRKSGLKIIETPGEGYVNDLGFLITKLSEIAYKGSNKVQDILMTISADLPLITGEIIDEVIIEYKECGKPAMCVAVPVEFFIEFNLKPHMVMGDIVPSGLNILRRNNNQQDEEVLELRKFELALNINSPEDLIFLEKYLKFKAFKQAIK
jgi:adenosylcobinamide-phosphate guanylyltransferase